jgi:hypothetical protein
MLVALDGGLGPVNYGALGIYWSKMKFTGEGRTRSIRGIGRIRRGRRRSASPTSTPVPLPPRNAPVEAIYNVGGMMTGGKVVNAIPQEVTFTVICAPSIRTC